MRLLRRGARVFSGAERNDRLIQSGVAKARVDMHYSAFTRAVITSGEFALPAKWRYCLSYERPIQAAFWDLVGRPLVGEIDLASHAGWENKALPDIKVRTLRRYNAWVSRKAVPESRASWGRLAIINAELPHKSPYTNVFGTGSRLGAVRRPEVAWHEQVAALIRGVCASTPLRHDSCCTIWSAVLTPAWPSRVNGES